MTQRDDLEPVGGLGIAAAKGGSVKSRRLGQIWVYANRVWQKEVSTPVPWGGKKKARLNLINRAGPSPREDDSR